MRDNQVIISLRNVLVARLASRGINAEVKQGNQPTTQGVPTCSLVSLYKIADKFYGFPERSEKWDEVNSVMRATYARVVESTFQFTCIVPQNAADDFELTPADVLKATASILQSDYARIALLADGLQVLRVQDIRTGYVTDDRGQFMANPTFDIVVTHRDTQTEIIGIVNTLEVNVNRV